MNVINFVSFYKDVFQMCLQCTISVCETHELCMNTFCMISIIKFWEAKFVMWISNIKLLFFQM
jgi:hypothetical protein